MSITTLPPSWRRAATVQGSPLQPRPSHHQVPPLPATLSCPASCTGCPCPPNLTRTGSSTSSPCPSSTWAKTEGPPGRRGRTRARLSKTAPTTVRHRVCYSEYLCVWLFLCCGNLHRLLYWIEVKLKIDKTIKVMIITIRKGKIYIYIYIQMCFRLSAPSAACSEVWWLFCSLLISKQHFNFSVLH